jgi:hypothetical protein
MTLLIAVFTILALIIGAAGFMIGSNRVKADSELSLWQNYVMQRRRTQEARDLARQLILLKDEINPTLREQIIAEYYQQQSRWASEDVREQPTQH